MEVISSIFTLLFIVIVLIAAFTFGFALLAWFFVLAMIITGLVVLKQLWFRFNFTRRKPPPDDVIPPSQPSGDGQDNVTVIEVDYEDIPPNKR